MKFLKAGQLVKLRYNGMQMGEHNLKVRSNPYQLDNYLGSCLYWQTQYDIPASPALGTKKKILAIVLEEAEEVDIELYHKCWVLPNKNVQWDGEFWFRREELEIIQPSTFDHQLLREI